MCTNGQLSVFFFSKCNFEHFLGDNNYVFLEFSNHFFNTQPQKDEYSIFFFWEKSNILAQILKWNWVTYLLWKNNLLENISLAIRSTPVYSPAGTITPVSSYCGGQETPTILSPGGGGAEAGFMPISPSQDGGFLSARSTPAVINDHIRCVEQPVNQINWFSHFLVTP